MRGFELTVDNARLLARLKKLGKVPAHLEYLTGANRFETVDETGAAGLSIILGPINAGRRGRKPRAIPVASDPDRMPQIKGDRLFRADVAPVGDDSYELVRQQKEGVALRTVVTGLLVGSHGSTTEDFAEIVKSGGKLRYHGAFPITADAAEVVGEGIDLDITAPSRVIADERFGRGRGLVGVPKQRAVQLEAVIGGPILVGQIDGELKIHELTKDGSWKVQDVTNSEYWQKKFMDLAMQDVTYLQEVEKANKREKTFKVIKPPMDHMDAA